MDSLFRKYGRRANNEQVKTFTSLGNAGVNVNHVYHYPSQVKTSRPRDNNFMHAVAAYDSSLLKIDDFYLMQNLSKASYSNYTKRRNNRLPAYPGTIRFCNLDPVQGIIGGTSYTAPHHLAIINREDHIAGESYTRGQNSGANEKTRYLRRN